MKIFITGGTGNIGQYVTKAVLAAGHQVVLLTRTPDRIPAYLTLPKVTVVGGNILQPKVLEDAMQGCDAVIHIALGWGNTPTEMLQHDTQVTVILMEAAEKAGVQQLLYTSSTAAMGPLRDGMDENAVLLPGDLYGATKAASEMYLLGFNQVYSGQGVYSDATKLRRNIIRPGYTFSNPAFELGASQSDQRFNQIAKAILKNEPLTFSANDGTQFLSSAQIAELYVKVLESDLNREVFLALGRQFVSWAEIATMTQNRVPESQSRITINQQKEDPSYYNVDKMSRVFGLTFAGDEDLADHIDWNLERARLELAGKDVHNPHHVW